MLSDPQKVSTWNYQISFSSTSALQTHVFQYICICRQDGATVDRGVKIREEANQLLLVLVLG